MKTAKKQMVTCSCLSAEQKEQNNPITHSHAGRKIFFARKGRAQIDANCNLW